MKSGIIKLLLLYYANLLHKDNRYFIMFALLHVKLSRFHGNSIERNVIRYKYPICGKLARSLFGLERASSNVIICVQKFKTTTLVVRERARAGRSTI